MFDPLPLESFPVYRSDPIIISRSRSHSRSPGLTGLISRCVSALWERMLTKKRQSARIHETLLRENVSSEELHQRVEELEELLKYQRRLRKADAGVCDAAIDRPKKALRSGPPIPHGENRHVESDPGPRSGSPADRTAAPKTGLQLSEVRPESLVTHRKTNALRTGLP